MAVNKYYEIVGVFHSIVDLNQAVDELFYHGVNQSYLSALANKNTIEQKLGKHYSKVKHLSDNENTPRVAFQAEENIALAEGAVIGILIYIGVLITGGVIIIKGGNFYHALRVSVVAAVTATIIGVLMARIISRHHKRYLDYQFKKGDCYCGYN
ncbi:MAG: hypothetical protein JKY53_13210 [Flavobacteriales bacterium]|nr:hypothetical protein [Flavobacteriales bacterium]